MKTAKMGTVSSSICLGLLQKTDVMFFVAVGGHGSVGAPCDARVKCRVYSLSRSFTEHVPVTHVVISMSTCLSAHIQLISDNSQDELPPALITHGS